MHPVILYTVPTSLALRLVPLLLHHLAKVKYTAPYTAFLGFINMDIPWLWDLICSLCFTFSNAEALPFLQCPSYEVKPPSHTVFLLSESKFHRSRLTVSLAIFFPECTWHMGTIKKPRILFGMHYLTYSFTLTKVFTIPILKINNDGKHWGRVETASECRKRLAM